MQLDEAIATIALLHQRFQRTMKEENSPEDLTQTELTRLRDAYKVIVEEATPDSLEAIPADIVLDLVKMSARRMWSTVTAFVDP